MKKKQLFVKTIETFRDNGTPERKTEYNLNGEVVRVVTYDELGQPLSGVCGDHESWRLVDDARIAVSFDKED